MKVGILTYHKSINYGSVLQAYALSKILKEKNYQVEIIDYEPNSYSALYGIFEHPFLGKNLSVNLKKIAILDLLFLQRRSFFYFRKKYLPLSQKKYKITDKLEEINYLYDCIICGSDQVWNISARDCDPIFFLPFQHKCKKIAYAVSINTAKMSEKSDTNRIREQILDFDFISVREQSGANKVAAFLKRQKPVLVAPDPTLLHRKEVFEKISSDWMPTSKYICLYCANYQNDTIEVATKLSQMMKLPVYTMFVSRTTGQRNRLAKKGVFTSRFHQAPQDFLSLIKHSTFVVTDSFHGTAFSIIFEKKFISVNDKLKNGAFADDERILGLLNSLGLLERYLKLDDISEDIIVAEINYEKVTAKRLELSGKALDMLINALET